LISQGGAFAVADVARFAITGADRLRYLNGQVSNDLRKLAPGRAMQACVLSAKGRLDAVVWIWSEPERFVVECDAALAEALAMRLERYIVADDVVVEPLPPAQKFHVFGPAAAGREGLEIARVGLPGVDVDALPADVLEATPDEIERLRIERCVPRWGAELGPDTLPAEAGLDATAVDFHKGCYIGQEVVSRGIVQGRPNWGLWGLRASPGSGLLPGQELRGLERNRPLARVRSVARSPVTGELLALAFVHREAARPGPLPLRREDGEVDVVVEQLPFLPEAASDPDGAVPSEASEPLATRETA
jgi:folate-binding protein YgfZ